MPTLREISNTLEKIKARAQTLEKAVAKKVAAKKAVVAPLTVAPPTTYTGPSIVDYLKFAGQPSSFASRSKLVAQAGITDYRGTAKQNIRLLNFLRTKAPPAVTPPAVTTTPTELSDAELYDIGKIQSDLTGASAKKTEAYNELIGLQSKQYETEYNKAGLGEIKTKVAGVDSDIANEKRVRDESIDKVRRNPYYSAAIITGEVAEIERTSNARLNRLIDQRNSIAGQFNAGIDDATRKVGYATKDAQTKYSYWENEEKRLSGLTSTYQTELRRQLERAEKAPTVIGTAETGYRQWDPATKTWKMIIPPTSKPTPGKKFQSIKDPFTGKIIGYFDPVTGETVLYSPKTSGTPGTPEGLVRTYTNDQMRENIRLLIKKTNNINRVRKWIDADKSISSEQKTRMKDILLPEEWTKAGKKQRKRKWWWFK